MMNDKIGIAKIISGELFPYLQELRIYGGIDDNEDFIIFGCHDDDQQKFYAGILAFDKQTGYQGFETVEDVERYWLELADMMLFVSEGDYVILEAQNAQ